MSIDQEDTTRDGVRRTAIVIGGGPAGLMAAEVLSSRGVQVRLYDAMPSVGRKFLLAGKGGLNLTHAENPDAFNRRYGERAEHMTPLLRQFDAAALRAWALQLGVDTFVGSSQRVFPAGMKAAPLLRACLHRLRAQGVQFHMRHRWLGWADNLTDAINTAPTEDQGGGHAAAAAAAAGQRLCFMTPQGMTAAHADVVVLALGGGSWARLGSDGAWIPLLRSRGVDVTALLPSNCGFDVAWSTHFSQRFAGHPLKSVTARFTDLQGMHHERTGEMLVTQHGLEGSLIYAWSAMLRQCLLARGSATIELDLAPGRSQERVTDDMLHPRGARSLSSHLQSRVGIHGVKAGMLREILGAEQFHVPTLLAGAIKSLPLTLTAMRPLDEAISSAGGVRFEALDARLMLQAVPGVFCAGEMLDWEAPTGGYLLSGCFASGLAAGEGAADWLVQAARAVGPAIPVADIISLS
ncbi:MAG: TIGR03862 family flavoprotein [Herminiimonas sp.]|nr:TIGR03862 family flavoprotein [Herminiimonas sp.]